MKILNNFIKALQILEKYSSDENEPFFFDAKDKSLVITTVDVNEVDELDKQLLKSLGFYVYKNKFRTSEWLFKPIIDKSK